jgi:hypothetical protein
MTNKHVFAETNLGLARRCVESGRNTAEVPNGYVNFELALAILDGCRSAINMANANDPIALLQQLQIASDSLELFQSGVAASSVQAARSRIEETIDALRQFVAPE